MIKATIKNNTDILAKAFIALLIVAAFIVNPKFSLAFASDDIPIEKSPIINVEARTSYEKGMITKRTAIRKINSHLSDLKTNEHIQEWEETDGSYEIVMKNGTSFKYQLN